MAISTRPVDAVTRVNLFIGMPFVEFGPAITGGFDPFFQLGIPDSTAIEKTIELIQLNDTRSGVAVLDREIISKLEARLNVGLFNFEPQVLQMFLGSDILTIVSGGATAVTNDPITVPTDKGAFMDLLNGAVTTEPLTALTCAPITSENVGSTSGTPFGETTGDLTLDFPILVIGDVTSYIETAPGGGTTERVANLVAGAAPAPGQIGIHVADLNTEPLSGAITYDTGEGPVAGTSIAVTYTPTFVFANLTDYVLDIVNGKVRLLPGGAGDGQDQVKSGQTLHADYSFTAVASHNLQPFVQREFLGRARVSQLTDTGINFIWNIPNVTFRLTDDDFAWSNDAFSIGTLIMNINNNGGAAPFGTFQTFPETP